MTPAPKQPNPTRYSWANKLKQHTLALYFCCQDSRCPRAVKLLALLIVAYALNPLDLIPDFIPVIGYLDDLILLPLAIWLVIKLIPDDIWQRCLNKAETATSLPCFPWMSAVIVVIWLAMIGLVGMWLLKLLMQTEI